MSLSIITLITSIILTIFMKNLINKITPYIIYGFTIFALIISIIYVYFVYDTYMFSSTMSVPCTCADGWQKYYIYFQAITMMLIILGSILISIKQFTFKSGYQGKHYKHNYKRYKR